MASHWWVVDALKLLGAQLIVWHHIAAYGPLGDALGSAAPDLAQWLFEDARMAVQIFLVVGGYLAARGFATLGALHWSEWASSLWQRYVRLALPLAAALVFALGCAALARTVWVDALTVPPHSLAQWLAHLLLLQDLLGFEALSAGVWYVAIDLQLYALLLVLWTLGRWHQGVKVTAVLGLAGTSVLVFNRDASLDVWGVYFFGSYALGAAAYQIRQRRAGWVWWWGAFLVAALALVVDFRERLALALLVAVILIQPWPELRGVALARVQRLLRAGGRSSYALFLLHFPVLLLVNAVFSRLDAPSLVALCLALAALWCTSLLLAWQFERRIEHAGVQWLLGLRPRSLRVGA